MLHDRHADAVEAGVLILFQLLELAVRKVSGMRIERGKHALNRGLRRLLVIDVARVITGDRRDGLVVVLLDLVGDAVRVLHVPGEAGEITPAKRAGKDRRFENYRSRRDGEFIYPASVVVRSWFIE